MLRPGDYRRDFCLRAGLRGWRRHTGAVTLITAVALLCLAPAASAAPDVQPTLVQTIQTSSFAPSSPDPSAIVWMPATNRFLVADSEVEEIPSLYQGYNLYTMTPTGSGVGTGTTLRHANKEPAGLGFDPATGTLYSSNDDKDRVWIVRPGADGSYGTVDDTTSYFSTSAFGSGDPEGVEYDPASGHVFVCDGSQRDVYEINPVNATFGDGNDSVSSFDFAKYGARDCEGLGLDGQRGTLLAVDPLNRKIYELSKAGALVRTLSLPRSVIPTTSTIFSSVTMAPSSDPTDSPAVMNYWVADRHVDNGPDPNENDGLIYELSVSQPPPNAPPSITLTNPADSATVSGTRTIQATASDDGGVARVRFAIDGVELATDTDGSDGWSTSWNTGSTADGAHTVTATAFDGAEQSASDSSNVTVDNTAPTVSVTSPADGAAVSGSVTVAASASDNTAVTSVAFKVDGTSIGTDSNGSDGWSVQWSANSVANGPHEITAVATDRGGNSTTSSPVAITVTTPPLLSIPVAQGTDDADELQDGSGTVRRTTGDIELGSGAEGFPTVAGMRFNSVSVPNGATITHADIQFQVDETKSSAANFVLRGQQVDNAATFGSTAFDITSRPRTAASVSWAAPAWTVLGAAGPDQRTPELKSVIQEIVDRSGWSPGNSLAIIVNGSGRRTAESFEGGAPPILHIAYTTP